MRYATGLLLILFAFLPGVAYAACPSGSAPKSLAGFDDYARSVLADWHVPGLALGVMRDGEALYCAGYGLGDLEQVSAATPETIFAIGSITKSFSVAGLAMLADEGRLNWDNPVRDILPDFTLADPIATAHTTPRDMVTHRTGMARHDMLWYGSGLDADQLYTGLRHLAPGAPFRSGWQYNNLMFTATGRITEALSGETWQNFTTRRLLKPLGMERTDFAVNENDPGRAKPYEISDNQVYRIPFYDISAIAPAGAINSTVADMLPYIAFHMRHGRHSGMQLLSQTQARAMQTRRVALDDNPVYAALGAPSYGMGFLISTYRGHKILWHSGGIDGFVALMAFLPDAGIGVIALSNLDRNPAPTILTRNLFDRLLGLKPLPWNDWVASDYLEWELGKRQEAAQHKAGRDTAIVPSRPLANFAGGYHHPAYGEVRITYENEVLMLRYGQFTLALSHYRGDIFEIDNIPTTSRTHLEVAFHTNESGEIVCLAVPFERSVADILFLRAE